MKLNDVAAIANIVGVMLVVIFTIPRGAAHRETGWLATSASR
jgi:hypothetical protein